MSSQLQLAASTAAAAAANTTSPPSPPTATTTTSSQPRSILKKPITHSSPKVISFYSGNEIKPQAKVTMKINGDGCYSDGNNNTNNDEDDPASNTLMYNMEKRITMHPHKEAASAAREKLHELELTHRINGDEDEAFVVGGEDDEAARLAALEDHLRSQSNKRSLTTTGNSLRKSALTQHWTGPGVQKRTRRKPTSAYILNNKQIDAEVINCARESICTFIDEFKRSRNMTDSDDERLLDRSDFILRAQFLEQIHDYLYDDEFEMSPFSSSTQSPPSIPNWDLESQQQQQPRQQQHQRRKSYALELGVSLSEPVMDRWFRAPSNSKQIASSQSSLALDPDRLKRFDFDNQTPPNKGVVNRSGSVAATRPDEVIYGSLPVNTSLNTFMQNLRQQRQQQAVSAAASPKKQPNEIRKSSSGSLHGSHKCLVSTATANKKAVRFADSFGFDLTSVRIITNSSFMFASVASELDQQDNISSTSTLSCPDFGSPGSGNAMFNAVSVPFLVLIPLFSIRRPINHDYVVKLDEYLFDYENKIVKCIAKVKNLSFEKRVYARITLNGWRTNYDLDAMYLRPDSSQPNQFDMFGFCIIIPEKSSLYGSTGSMAGVANVTTSGSGGKMDDCFCRIEFALCSRQNGVEYWDNNLGENYKFQCFYNIKS